MAQDYSRLFPKGFSYRNANIKKNKRNRFLFYVSSACLLILSGFLTVRGCNSERKAESLERELKQRTAELRRLENFAKEESSRNNFYFDLGKETGRLQAYPMQGDIVGDAFITLNSRGDTYLMKKFSSPENEGFYLESITPAGRP